jgi:DNA polymerase-1
MASEDLVKKHTNKIREFIVARPGYVLIGADYEQLEPSIFAHTSGDKALQDIFTSGKDFYSEVAIRTEQLTGVSSDKKAENYLGSVDKSKRQKAKAYALGIAYGMTGYKLQFELDIPLEEADRLVRDYLNAFPDLERWMNASRDKVLYDGYIRTEAGRVRHMPQVMELHKKYGTSVGDSLALWKRYHDVPAMWQMARQDHKTYKNLLNNAINFQVQGLAASILNRAMIAINKKLKTEKLEAHIIMSVHDEIVIECLIKDKDRVKVIIQETMENIVKLSVPLRAVPKEGSCYKECK